MICLAGHIDHGKSAIVHALTGAKVDRLPEERRRGITIELGFAHFDDFGGRFALIDVPGHERFIHTMVAGASGVDAALLVIAADDSVMPQTREHVALLEMLGVRRGVIAISKCDLADDEQLEMVDLEVADLVATTFLAKAPRIRVAAPSGMGMAELRTAIVEAAKSSAMRPTHDTRFRLPIDRAFSPTGQGVVVTGTVWRGTARVGDTLHLLPEKILVRIRRLQSQGADVEKVSAGERAAINLVGVKGSAIDRGHELGTPGAFEPAKRHLAHLKILPEASRGLKHRQIVRLHLGANQATCQILFGQRSVAPGEAAFAVLRCAKPVVAEYEQPFVLRQFSPARTIGGGRIIGPALQASDRLTRSLAAAPGLADTDLKVRLTAYIDLRREARFDEASESWIGMGVAQCDDLIQQLERQEAIIRIPGPVASFITYHRFDQLKQLLFRRCQRELERRRPASRVPLSAILAAMKRSASPAVLDALLARLAASKELIVSEGRIGLRSGPELTNRQRLMVRLLVGEVSAGGVTPPTLKEFAEQHNISPDDVEALVQVAVDEGQFMRVSPQLVMVPAALETLRQSLLSYFETSSIAKVGVLRERWKMTRKHAVPIFEFFDQRQITVRSGDDRAAGPRISLPIDEALR
ncbi:MAG: selenocysteine-specific translation elongation factor [Pirellulales bacterium]|nr:selenocysteine-specific translation elongation factor [Pirellulales bacterium]